MYVIKPPYFIVKLIRYLIVSNLSCLTRLTGAQMIYMCKWKLILELFKTEIYPFVICIESKVGNMTLDLCGRFPLQVCLLGDESLSHLVSANWLVTILPHHIVCSCFIEQASIRPSTQLFTLSDTFIQSKAFLQSLNLTLLSHSLIGEWGWAYLLYNWVNYAAGEEKYSP